MLQCCTIGMSQAGPVVDSICRLKILLSYLGLASWIQSCDEVTVLLWFLFAYWSTKSVGFFKLDTKTWLAMSNLLIANCNLSTLSFQPLPFSSVVPLAWHLLLIKRRDCMNYFAPFLILGVTSSSATMLADAQARLLEGHMPWHEESRQSIDNCLYYRRHCMVYRERPWGWLVGAINAVVMMAFQDLQQLAAKHFLWFYVILKLLRLLGFQVFQQSVVGWGIFQRLSLQCTVQAHQRMVVAAGHVLTRLLAAFLSCTFQKVKPNSHINYLCEHTVLCCFALDKPNLSRPSWPSILGLMASCTPTSQGKIADRSGLILDLSAKQIHTPSTVCPNTSHTRLPTTLATARLRFPWADQQFWRCTALLVVFVWGWWRSIELSFRWAVDGGGSYGIERLSYAMEYKIRIPFINWLRVQKHASDTPAAKTPLHWDLSRPFAWTRVGNSFFGSDVWVKPL